MERIGETLSIIVYHRSNCIGEFLDNAVKFIPEEGLIVTPKYSDAVRRSQHKDGLYCEDRPGMRLPFREAKEWKLGPEERDGGTRLTPSEMQELYQDWNRLDHYSYYKVAGCYTNLGKETYG